MKTENRIPSLDGLRALSITIVMLAHFNNHWQFPFLNYLVNAGILGVYIFFVISGFLITTLLIREKQKKQNIDLKKFYIRRFLRIVPLALIYISTIIVVSILKGDASLSQNFWIPALYLSNISGLGVVSYLFLHFWSLSAEEQYYIFVPTLSKLSIKKFKFSLIIIFISSFIFRFFSNHYPDSNILTLLADITRNLDGLIIGSFIAILYSENKIPVLKLLEYKTPINLLAFPLILLLNHETSNFVFRIFANHSFYSFIIGLIIIVNIQVADDPFYKFLNNKIMIQIGVISYSLYIWQQLFSSGLIELPIYVNFILAFITAFLSYNYLEKPFLKLKKQFTRI